MDDNLPTRNELIDYVKYQANHDDAEAMIDGYTERVRAELIAQHRIPVKDA
jgi:hypothetical protein